MISYLRWVSLATHLVFMAAIFTQGIDGIKFSFLFIGLIYFMVYITKEL